MQESQSEEMVQWRAFVKTKDGSMFKSVVINGTAKGFVFENDEIIRTVVDEKKIVHLQISNDPRTNFVFKKKDLVEIGIERLEGKHWVISTRVVLWKTGWGM